MAIQMYRQFNIKFDVFLVVIWAPPTLTLYKVLYFGFILVVICHYQYPFPISSIDLQFGPMLHH